MLGLGTAVAESTEMHLPVSGWQTCRSSRGVVGSAFGQVTRELIRQLTPQFVFMPSRLPVVTRSISSSCKLDEQPLAAQQLLAVFLYSPPGLMQVANARQNLPGWLAQAYEEIYGSAPAQPLQPQHQVAATNEPAMPDFGTFPGSLQELVGNRIHLNRILGLSNLYYIDPEDRENVTPANCTQLVDVILSAPESSLEAIYWETSEIAIGPWFVRAFRMSP